MTETGICPICGEPTLYEDGKHYCFRSCSEIKVKEEEEEKTQ